jgi:hypothetical protein
VILVSDIGEGSSALYCLTNRTPCCGANTGGANRGVWKHLDNSTVSEVTTADIYWTRAFSSLLLNSRNSAVGATGVYKCLIPDERNILRTLTATIIGESTLLCIRL